jgi:transposase
MNPTIEELTAGVEQETRKRPEVLRLMTHPGAGPLTALAYMPIIGTPTRFQRGKQIGTYVGMIPCEESSARKQRLGHISKQGNSLLRFLLVAFVSTPRQVHVPTSPVAEWCHRYEPVDKQLTPNPKLRGHYQYYGRPTSSRIRWQFYKRSAKSGGSGSVAELAGRN